MTNTKFFEALTAILLATFLLVVGGCLTPGTIIASLLIAVPTTKKIMSAMQACAHHV